MHVVHVHGCDAEVLRPPPGRGAPSWRQCVVCVPREDARVGGACAHAVVLEGDVEGDVEEELAVGGEEGAQTVLG